MDLSRSLICVLQIVLLFVHTAAEKVKLRDRCEYIEVLDWSDCDPLTMTSTRSLELISGDTGTCNKNRIEKRYCGMGSGDDNKKKHNFTRHQLNKKLSKQGKKRKKPNLLSDCKYRKGKWSRCDLQQEQTLVQTLVSGSPELCKPVIVVTRACPMKLQMADHTEKEALGGFRKGKKNSREKHKSQIRQNKKKKKFKFKKTKEKINSKNFAELSEEESPPSPAELNVEPFTTFAIVSWQPPQRHGFNEDIVVDSYNVGYGQGFPDLHTEEVDGTETTYKIQNLEPGKEYIVSLTARTVWGVSQPLYVTIRTPSSADGKTPSPMILPPVAVKPDVLSSEAINVSWVDTTVHREPTSEAREYYLRYQQLIHPTNSMTSHHEFKIERTSKTFLVVDGLQPFTKYEFSVMTSDGEKNSTWSLMSWNVTQEAAPSTGPEDLTIIQDPGNPDHVTLSWQPPSKTNGILTGYQVSFNATSFDGESLMATKDVEGNKLSVTLMNLIPGLTYNFSVRASNSQGLGPPTTINNYHLAEAQPSVISSSVKAAAPHVIPEDRDGTAVRFQIEPVRNLQVDVLSPNSVVVTWQDPGLMETFDEVSSSPPTYTIRYRDLVLERANYTLITTPFTTVYIADLLPLTWYEFKVKVHKYNQESEWSMPVKNRTFASDVIQRPIKNGVRNQHHLYHPVKNSDKDQQQFGQMVTLSWQLSTNSEVKDEVISSTIPQPENLQVVVISSYSALISWHDPDLDRRNQKSQKHTYTLRYRELNGKSSGYKFASPTLSSIFMVDLEPATKYEFSVRIDRGDQHSEWSSPVVNTTFESAPSTGPGHVTVIMDDEDPTTALLRWRPPEHPNGDITGYIVFYETATDRKSATVPAGELSYRVPFLKPHTKYSFRIGARNSQGFSPLSNRVVYRTPRVVGSPPADVTVTPASDDLYNAVVSWQPPSQNKRRIKYYTVTRYTDDGKQRMVVRVPGFTLTTVVTKLLPSTVYHFTVQASYERGSGPHSLPVSYSIPKELLQDG